MNLDVGSLRSLDGGVWFRLGAAQAEVPGLLWLAIERGWDRGRTDGADGHDQRGCSEPHHFHCQASFAAWLITVIPLAVNCLDGARGVGRPIADTLRFSAGFIGAHVIHGSAGQS